MKDKGLPLAVGFGLNTPEHIARVSSYAEGAVVGSALVNLLDRHTESEQEEAVRQYIRSLSQR
jgi:tryptophan synthase alpha chain